MVLSHCSEFLWLCYNKSDGAGFNVVVEWLDLGLLYCIYLNKRDSAL